MHSVSLRTCVWTPAPVPKSPVWLTGWAEASGVPYAHAYTYKLTKVKRDKSHVEQIGVSKHIIKPGWKGACCKVNISFVDMNVFKQLS